MKKTNNYQEKKSEFTNSMNRHPQMCA